MTDHAPPFRILSRRALGRGLLVTVAAAATLALSAGAPARAADGAEFRIGWQKGASLAVTKARGNLEKELAAKGVKVTWLEFTAGPQMLEALNVGSIDFGNVGETPPVFAQAAGADLLYVGNEPPAPQAEAILVPKDSPIKSVADLKGKRVVLNKGSNVHYMLVRLLQQAGLTYNDIEVAFLPPADARAAFEKGAVDAWAIWDPFASAAEVESGARRLVDATGAADNHIFFIASRPFVDKHPEVISTALNALNADGKWISDNPAEAAAVIAPQIRISQEIAERSIRNFRYGVTPLSDDVIARQQTIADTFTDLKLIPKKLDVASVVWRPAAGH